MSDAPAGEMSGSADGTDAPEPSPESTKKNEPPSASQSEESAASRRRERWVAWAAVGTGITSIAAIVLAAAALNLQLDDQREQDERRTAFAASQTTWWVESGDEEGPAIYVRNSSTEPVSVTLIESDGVDSFVRGVEPVNAALFSERNRAAGRTRGGINLVRVGVVRPCSLVTITMVNTKGQGEDACSWLFHLKAIIVDSKAHGWVRDQEGSLFKARSFNLSIGLRSAGEALDIGTRHVESADGCGAAS